MTIKEIQYLWKKSQQDLIFVQATALAYTTLLSLVPMLVVAFSVFKAVGGLDDLPDRLRPLIEQNLAPSFGEKIFEYIIDFIKKSHAGSLGVLGLMGFVITSVMTISKIEESFNTVWGVHRARNLLERFTTYWSLLTIGPLLLGASVLLSSKFLSWARGDSGDVSKLFLGAITFAPYVLSSFLFTFTYYFIPNTSIHKGDALKAGILTGVVFECAKLIYARYATATLAHSTFYGSLSTLPVFLLWLYVIWVILLFGAEICCYFKYKRHGIPYRHRHGERLNPFILSDILEDLANSGKTPKGGLTQSELLATLRLPASELIGHLDFLEEHGWVVSTQLDLDGERKYHLAVNKDVLNMGVIMEEINEHRYQPRSPHGMVINKHFLQLWREWTLESTKTQKSKNKEKTDPTA